MRIKIFRISKELILTPPKKPNDQIHQILTKLIKRRVFKLIKLKAKKENNIKV